jgi:hypothetical protein
MLKLSVVLQIAQLAQDKIHWCPVVNTMKLFIA